MSSSNQTKLDRNFPICLDDRVFDKIHCGNSVNDEHFKKKNVASSFPDIVSCSSTTLSSQNSDDGAKDPDIVRSSSSSSDDKSVDARLVSDKAPFSSKYLTIVHSSVSSFSSSDGSKQSTSSDLDAKHKPSTVSSFSSVDNDNQQDDAFLNKERDTNYAFNQDSVFIEESEDVFDQLQLSKEMQQTNIVEPIVESSLSPSSTKVVSRTVFSSEEGQKARNHYRSSGYTTGSKDGNQSNMTSEISVNLQQQPNRKEDDVVSEITHSHTLSTEEPKCVENDFTPKNTRPYPTSGNYVVNPDFQNQTMPGLVPSPPHNKHPSSNNTPPTDPYLVSDKINTKQNSHLVSQYINSSTGPLETATNGDMQPQGAHARNDLLNTSSPQGKKLSSIAARNFRKMKLNVTSAVNQCPQVLPQVSTINTPLTDLQQQSVIANGKSNIVYTNPPHHISMLQSLQHHLTVSGSLNDNVSQMSSSSSSGSCFLPQSAEYRWSAEQSHVSFAKLLLLMSGPEFSESSGESRYHLESLIKKDAHVSPTQLAVEGGVQQSANVQDIPNFKELLSNSMIWSDLSSVMMSSVLEGHFDRDLWEKLQRSIRCQEAECDDTDCVQIKTTMAVLGDARNHVSSLCEADKMLLMTMFSHAVYLCDHPKCPFLWCGDCINNIDHLSWEDCLFIMKQRLENFADDCLLLNCPNKYMTLNPTLSYASMPVEGQDWVRVCMMGDTRQSVLVQPISSEISDTYSDTKFWVIKKVSTSDEGDHWGLYSKLRDINHKSIVTFLWAASFEDHMLICTMYEDYSLHEYLPSLPQPQFRFVTIFRLMNQLTSALDYLNNLGIAYLYWISKNILMTSYTAEDFVVKISNFSCSVLLTPPDGKQPCYDGGHLLLALPRHIIAPEFRDNFRVEYASDVWGLGCLLHELVTGYPVWHEHRHVLDNDFRKMVGETPNIPSACPELVDVFTACWEVEPSKRVLLSDLEIMLIQAFHVHLNSFS